MFFSPIRKDSWQLSVLVVACLAHPSSIFVTRTHVVTVFRMAGGTTFSVTIELFLLETNPRNSR